MKQEVQEGSHLKISGSATAICKRRWLNFCLYLLIYLEVKEAYNKVIYNPVPIILNFVEF